MLNSLIRLLKSESRGQHSFMLCLDNEEQEEVLVLTGNMLMIDMVI